MYTTEFYKSSSDNTTYDNPPTDNPAKKMVLTFVAPVMKIFQTTVAVPAIVGNQYMW